jgi:hypothetical protein
MSEKSIIETVGSSRHIVGIVFLDSPCKVMSSQQYNDFLDQLLEKGHKDILKGCWIIPSLSATGSTCWKGAFKE